MPGIKKIIPAVFVWLLCSAFSLDAAAQKSSEKAAAVKTIVDSQHFTFYAQYAQPRQGTQRYLTSEYTLRITKDSIISYLPYFGRAYSGVGYGSGDGPVQFTSTQFEYNTESTKKGGWYINVKPKDAPGINQVSLDIRPGGNCTVTVISMNRDPISYTGYLK